MATKGLFKTRPKVENQRTHQIMVLRFVVQLLLVTLVAAELKPLPHNIIVTHYALDISISMPAANQTLRDIVNSVQPAMVDIFFEVLEDTDKIYLNAELLTFYDILISNGTGYARTSYTYTPIEQLLVLQLPFTLTAGERRNLKIEYGYLTQKAPAVNYGLFFTFWWDENDEDHYVAGTHFEPISARKMVPCFDDPSFRATWQVTVYATPGYSVSSNTKRIALTKNEHVWKHTFAKTPSIPSYLVAIVVHGFDERKFKTPKGYEYNIIGPNATLYNGCDIAQMEFIGKAIDHLMDKFKVDKYPFDKIDFIRLPFHNAMGMENPGLITWRDYVFCQDTSTAQQYVLHELLHQWFGNIVTPISWGNVVMSEGLTQYFTRRVFREIVEIGYLNRIFPGQLLSKDNLPIVAKPTDLDQSKYIGSRHYDKSAFLFEMMANLIGEDAFDKAINIHLKLNENGWASFDQFLAIADAVSTLGYDLEHIFKPYFTRTEYPVIFIGKFENFVFDIIPVLVKNDNDTIFGRPISMPRNESDYYVPVYFDNPKYNLRPILKIGRTLRLDFPGEEIVVPRPISWHRTCYLQPELWLLAARHVEYDDVWKHNVYLDFLVCTKHQSSPIFKEVLKILKTEDRMIVPKIDYDENWLKY